MGQATRRLDVDTKWMAAHGVRASKDFLTVEENNRLENYGEETVGKYWAAVDEDCRRCLQITLRVI